MKYSSIDEYVGSFPENVRAALDILRKAIRESAPGAEEAISYGIPAFRLNGYLIYFAGYKNHVSVYPVTASMEKAFGKELAPYRSGKGTARFPLEKVPVGLVKKMVRLRVKENSEKKRR